MRLLRPHRSRRPLVGAGLAVLSAALLLAGCTGVHVEKRAGAAVRPTQVAPRATSRDRPNIVFVLTDDLSSELVQYVPHLRALAKRGMSFSNYTVTDSLCCPSRASIFTGQFPHDTRVLTNTGRLGGFETFYRRGDQNRTFATALQAAGYQTAFMGKYLNGYEATVSKGDAPPHYVPPGWSEWDGLGDGYHGYGYTINHDGRVQHAHGEYLTTKLQGLGESFMQTSMDRHARFMLEVATFTPHFPYVPAPQDRGTFSHLRAPRTAAFDRLPKHAPRWLARHPPLTRGDIAKIDTAQRLRVEDVQSIDRMLGGFERLLAKNGQLRNTVFVFSSDNGMHVGDYRLGVGKLTAFDTDIVVPLIVAGPHIPAGQVNPAVVESVDLAPTFEQLAGAPVPSYVDGRSLVPLLHGQHPAWRTTALIEHHGPAFNPADPDRQGFTAGFPPSYDAIRTARYTFVSYADGQREYYDRSRDPWELDNIWASLPLSRRRHLLALTTALVNCHGNGCWLASRRNA